MKMRLGKVFTQSCRISEPEIKAPWAISLAMAFTYIGGWLFTIVLCYCMGEPTDILGIGPQGTATSPMGQPVAQIFYNSLGKGGGLFFTICAFIILQFVCFTATQALGRTVFAFSRDRLLPFSHVWTKVNRFTNTPLYAVWISIACCIAINLVGLGSYAAISGVFNVCAIALDWSYIIPILVSHRCYVDYLYDRANVCYSVRCSSDASSQVLGIWASSRSLSTHGLLFGLSLCQLSSSCLFIGLLQQRT